MLSRAHVYPHAHVLCIGTYMRVYLLILFVYFICLFYLFMCRAGYFYGVGFVRLAQGGWGWGASGVSTMSEVRLFWRGSCQGYGARYTPTQHTGMCACACACLRLRLRLRVLVCEFVCTYMYVSLYVCIFACIQGAFFSSLTLPCPQPLASPSYVICTYSHMHPIAPYPP